MNEQAVLTDGRTWAAQPWTTHIIKPLTARLLRVNAVRAWRKSYVSLASVVMFWLGATLAVVFVSYEQWIAAACTSTLIWQVGYSLDCLDGMIARSNGTASNAGMAVDAAADVLAMTGVAGSLLYIFAERSGLSSLMLALFGMGFVARCAGPLWTVSAKLARDAAATGMHKGEARLARLTWLRLTFSSTSDYGLLLVLFSAVMLTGDDRTWTALVALNLISGLYVAFSGLLNMLIRDGWS